MKRKGLKIILATTMCIFNLFVCFSGVLAWFAAHKIDDATGLNVKVGGNGLSFSYKIYKYDDDQKQAIEATGQADALKLQKYDSVITSRNVNTPIILEFSITGMNLGENTPLYINTHCSNNTTTDRVLSNIVQLQFAPISAITSTDANEIYNDAVDYFSENSIDEVVFKAKENNIYTKTQDVSYTLSNYQSAIVGGTLRLFIKLDYSESLIRDFNFSITDIQTTSFANDLTLINCYTDED